MPYGHIAGKVIILYLTTFVVKPVTSALVQTWGDPSGKPILGLHGWLDNAGTHDHLAPLLSEVTCHLMRDCDI